MTKRKVMLRTPKDVTPVSLINSLTCFFAALNQIGATSPNSFLPQSVLKLPSNSHVKKRRMNTTLGNYQFKASCLFRSGFCFFSAILADQNLYFFRKTTPNKLKSINLVLV